MLELIVIFVCKLVSFCFGFAIIGLGIAAFKLGIEELVSLLKGTNEEVTSVFERIFYVCCIISIGIPFLFICAIMALTAFGIIPFPN